MNTLQQMEQWYSSQCDGDWEHMYGVDINTLDNPGWIVKIDLRETELEGVSFGTVIQGNPEDSDWIHLHVESHKFHGAGDPSKLNVILQAFLAWAGQHTET